LFVVFLSEAFLLSFLCLLIPSIWESYPTRFCW